jgi:hypothetical protein
MTKRLVTALKAHGPTKPLDLDAVVQVCAAGSLLAECKLLCLNCARACSS